MGAWLAVAEWLVLGCAAPAERDAVAYFVGKAVGGDDGDAAAQPQWPATFLGRVFDQPDGNRELRFDRLAGGLVPGYQPTRRAIANLPDEHGADGGVVGFTDLVPYLAVRVAEAPECAQVFRVGERHAGAIQGFGLFKIGLATGHLGPIKTDLGMAAVAERLFPGSTAAAERVCVFGTCTQVSEPPSASVPMTCLASGTLPDTR